jgi:hypothetical protein
MRRLPPQNVEENLSKLLDIVDPDLGDDLLSAIDQPLKVRRCKQTGKDYLACDYNRDGDSYRYDSMLRTCAPALNATDLVLTFSLYLQITMEQRV